jgi:enoyl-CoA hydratase/carnithine racemase
LTSFRRNVTEPGGLRAAGIAVSKSTGGFDVELPRSLKAERRGEIAILFLARPQKRNAIDDATVAGIEAFFAALPDAIKAVVLAGEGEHFCAGLDLAELTSRDIARGIAHSRSWHRAFERIEFGKAPVVAVLHGAVVGGGLEIAAACHIRVAEASAYYALPEGSRGIFVGGGGAVRLPRLIGTARMMDMMLTGRVYSA